MEKIKLHIELLKETRNGILEEIRISAQPNSQYPTTPDKVIGWGLKMQIIETQLSALFLASN